MKIKLDAYHAAIDDYYKAVTINTKILNIYSSIGSAKSLPKDYQGAITTFDKAIAMNPQHARSCRNRGYAKAFLKIYHCADLRMAFSLGLRTVMLKQSSYKY